jgi:hypothetical protein
MRKVALAAILAASLVSTAALAAGTNVTGPIKNLDAKGCNITLGTSKTVYSFGKTCDFSKLKVGEKVTITYTMNGKVYAASAVKAA